MTADGKTPTNPMTGTASSQTPRVSIIVVSYNTCAETLACLASLQAEMAGFSHEVIVIDNASPDGSAAAIRGEHPHIRLIESEDNLGFARANNVAGVVRPRARAVLRLMTSSKSVARSTGNSDALSP